MSTNIVTQIYELKTVGYDDTLTKLNSLKVAYDEIAASKRRMDQAAASTTDAAQADALIRKIDEQARKMRALEQQINTLKNAYDQLTAAERAAANTPDTAATKVSEYAKLVEAYKQATARARELATAQGVESQAAQQAARIAASYRQELLQVNAVVRNGTTQTNLLTEAQARNREAARQQNQETRQIAREALAAANSVEQLRAQLALATARRNRLEIDSTEFREAQEEVAKLNQQLLQIESRAGDFRRNVGNYASGFNGLSNSINQITREFPAFTNSVQTGFLALSNNLPIFFDEISRARTEISRLRAEGQQVPSLFQQIGRSIFSLSSLLSIGVTLLVVYSREIGEFITSLFRGREALTDFTARQRTLNQVLSDSNGTYAEAVRNVKELEINVGLARQGLIRKEEVVRQYNESMGETVGQVQTLDEVEQSLVRNGDAYIRMMLLKAAANQALEEAAKRAVEAERARLTTPEENLTTGDRLIAFGAGSSSAPGFVPGQNAALGQQFAQARGEQRRATAVAEAQKDADTLESIAQRFQQDAARIASEYGFTSFVLGGNPGAARGSSLDSATQEELKRIEAQRDILLAAERTRVNEIARVRRLSADEEIQTQRNLEQINESALQASISLLERKKNLNAEELQTLAEFREQLSELYLNTSNRINQIEEQRFRNEERLINQRLRLRTQELERERELIQQNPQLSPTQAAQAQLEIDQQILAQQIVALTALEQQKEQFNQEALERQQEAVQRAAQVVRASQNRVDLAEIADIRLQGQRRITELQGQFAITRRAILESDRTTLEQKRRQLEQLDRSERRSVLSAELEVLNTEVAAKQRLLQQGLISEQEYLAAVAAARQKAAELAGVSGGNQTPINNARLTLGQLVQGGTSGTGGLRGLLGIEQGTETDQLLGQAIAQSYQIAQEAMNNFFQAEETRIRQNLRVQLERLRIEEEQALFRAQSTAEQESLRRQFDARKREEERAAGERLKRIKVNEARIALATELANIAVAAAQNPLNGVTLGAAGIAMYSTLAALALGRYALNVAAINRTQFFEKGGNLKSDTVPVRGGEIGGAPHGQGGAPFTFNGQPAEAEVKELAIVRTKDAPKSKVFSLTGTQRQIASMLNVIGGGRPFASGGSMGKFEFGGALGEALQPPTFIPQVSASIAGNQALAAAQIAETKAMREDLARYAAEQSARIDRITVINDVRSSLAAEQKFLNQSNVATL